MKKKRKLNSINIVDLPHDVIKLIVSYSPRECLQVSKLFCRIVRSSRTQIKIGDYKKYNISSKSVLNTIFSSNNITRLNVNGWTKWNDSTLQYLARMIKSGYFKNLRQLHMRNCNNVSNKSLHIFLTNIGKNLNVLDVFNCKNITFKVFGMSNENLQALYLGYSKTTDAPSENSQVLESLFNTILNKKPIVLFPNLQRLQIFNYTGIKSLSPLVNIAKTLKSLDIRGCTSIDPSEFKYIARLTKLEELHIGMNVENEHLLEIFNSCTNISVLDISESQISFDVVKAMCSNLTKLSRLKLSKCSTITNEFLSLILSSLSHLTHIDVAHCWRLSNALYDSVRKIPAGSNLSKIGLFMCSMDSAKMIYRFNCAGADSLITVVHAELQIDTKP